MKSLQGTPGVRVGTMMVQEGLLLPTSLGLETGRYSDGWRVVTGLDSFSLGSKVRAIGWHLFFMAGEVSSIALGRGGEKSLRRALRRMVAKVRTLQFNCLEVSKIVPRHFLGIPYVAITGHSYHIQQSWVIDDADERRRLSRAVEWACG